MAKSTTVGRGFIGYRPKDRNKTRVYQCRSDGRHACVQCDEEISSGRYLLGYITCLSCGEKLAKAKKHCVVPMPKSNYILVTDFSLLKGLNSSHKGGVA